MMRAANALQMLLNCVRVKSLEESSAFMLTQRVKTNVLAIVL